MEDAAISATAGSYRILSKIADGGMGTVYRGEHMLIGRHVAIKVLLPEFTANRQIVMRFFNEAKATSAIHHPGIVEIFDFGYLDNGRAYIVMELLEGFTLGQRIKGRGTMGEGEAAALLRGVCSALAAAHDKGIVHRDLKPDNIFLLPDLDNPGAERAKILDFGIAKLTDFGEAATSTKTGMVMGTPTYMSPEQCRGSSEVDHRADLYSLGCIFYQLIVGRPPFANQGAGEVIGMHLFLEPDPPSRHRPGISAETEALIMRLLQKDPSKRPQTARDLMIELQAIAFAHGIPGSVPPTQWSHPNLRQFSQRGTTQPPPLDPTPAPVTGHPTTGYPRTSPPASTTFPEARRSKVGLAIAILLLVGVAAAALFATQPWAKQSATRPSASANPSPTPVSVPTPIPTPTATPTPTPTATPTAIAPPTAPPTPVATPTPTPSANPTTTSSSHPKPASKPSRPDSGKHPVKKPDGEGSSDLPIETTVE